MRTPTEHRDQLSFSEQHVTRHYSFRDNISTLPLAMASLAHVPSDYRAYLGFWRSPQPRSSSMSSRPGGAFLHRGDLGCSLRAFELLSESISAHMSAAESSGRRSGGGSSLLSTMKIMRGDPRHVCADPITSPVEASCASANILGVEQAVSTLGAYPLQCRPHASYAWGTRVVARSLPPNHRRVQ